MYLNDGERRIKIHNRKKQKLEKLRETEWMNYEEEVDEDGETLENENRDS